MTEFCRVGVVELEVGRYHVDKKGTGRIYVPKALVKVLGFKSGDRVLIRVVSSDKLVIEKFEEAVLQEGAAQ